jgi:hypothetical protein
MYLIDASLYLPRAYENAHPDPTDATSLLQRLREVCGLRLEPTDQPARFIGYFRGIEVALTLHDRSEGYPGDYALAYGVDLGHSRHCVATRYCNYGSIPNIDADCGYMVAQATIADQYPDRGALTDNHLPEAHLAFRIDVKLGGVQGYYTGYGIKPIYCNKPPSLSAIIKRIERKRQK